MMSVNAEMRKVQQVPGRASVVNQVCADRRGVVDAIVKISSFSSTIKGVDKIFFRVADLQKEYSHP